MKRLSIVFSSLILILLTTTTSCLDEKLDITIPFSLSFDGNLDLPLPTVGLTAPFDVSDSISIEVATELEDYLDRLKKLTIESVELHIANFSGNGSAEIEGRMEMNGSYGSADAPFGPANLQATSDSGLPIIMEFSEDEQTDISTALLAFEKLQLRLAGTASNPPVSFDYEMVFNFKAVANPLD